MVKVTSFFISLVFILSLLVSPVWAGGGKVRGEKAKGYAGSSTTGTAGKGDMTSNRATNRGPE